MLFSITAILVALVGLTAAVPSANPPAPGLERRNSGLFNCKDAFNEGDHSYQDGGCGTVIHPWKSSVCLQTAQDTKEHGPVLIRKCESSEYGGRFDMEFGTPTLLKFKQSKYNTFCLVPNDHFTNVEMATCDDSKLSHYWTTDGELTQIKMAYPPFKCLNWDGYLGGELPGALIKAKLGLQPCNATDEHQQFIIPTAGDVPKNW